jgi:parallel beta-helix repeat protein
MQKIKWIPILLSVALAALINFAILTPINAQPSEVWIDDDWVGCNPGDPVAGHICGNDAFAKIQDGIDTVASPGTVNVAAGTYLENINFLGKAIMVKSERGPKNTIINAGGNGSAVIFESGEQLDSILDGFTITNAGDLNSCWAIICSESSATIINNIIKDNQGWGIYLYKSNSIIRNNYIYGTPDLYRPFDAIHCEEGSPIIEKNTIFATGPNGNIDAIYVSDLEWNLPQSFRIRSNIILGRIWAHTSSPKANFENEISSNIIVIENGFSEAINVGSESPATLLIANNTIVKGGGINLQRGGTNTRIINNIIVESNRGIASWSGYFEILNNNLWGNVQNYYGLPDQTGISGNISADPIFVDSHNGDYHLQASSPCIDSGTNQVVGSKYTDFEGGPRILDGDNDATAIVDMGADEAFISSTEDNVGVGIVSGGTMTGLTAVDPDTIEDTPDKPDDLPYGLIEMVIEDVTGEMAVVKVYLPEAAPPNYRWYKHMSTGEWIDFSRDFISGGTGDGAEFNAARTEVTLHITDNGQYDDDPTNMIIKDPSGLAMTHVGGEGGGGG